MANLPVPITFDWDAGNAEKNWQKHVVAQKEAEEIFLNEPLIIVDNPKHSGEEQRFLALGITNLDRKLTIIFTIRKDKIRVISARDQSKKERREYEKA